MTIKYVSLSLSLFHKHIYTHTYARAYLYVQRHANESKSEMRVHRNYKKSALQHPLRYLSGDNVQR